jgi:hypothetical protein
MHQLPKTGSFSFSLAFSFLRSARRSARRASFAAAKQRRHVVVLVFKWYSAIGRVTWMSRSRYGLASVQLVLVLVLVQASALALLSRSRPVLSSRWV